jgi:hypothetical protein
MASLARFLPARLRPMLLGGPVLRFQSSLTPEQVLAEIGRHTTWFRAKEAQIWGRVTGNTFFVYWRTPIYRDSYRPVFHGWVAPAPGGSVIEGQISTFTFTKIFLGLWFGFLGFFTLISLPTLIGPVFGIGLMAAMYGMIAFTNRFSRGEDARIVEYLQTLDPVPPPLPDSPHQDGSARSPGS